MTKEQIIDGLKFTVEMFLLDPSTGETITEPRNDMDKITIDACRGAIELLEQESCEESVNRQAVLNKINEHWLNGTVAYRIIERISDDIKTLPSVKPQERTGRWIEISRGFECDQCHGIDTDGLEPPYCKWCVTQMKGAIRDADITN